MFDICVYLYYFCEICDKTFIECDLLFTMNFVWTLSFVRDFFKPWQEIRKSFVSAGKQICCNGLANLHHRWMPSWCQMIFVDAKWKHIMLPNHHSNGLCLCPEISTPLLHGVASLNPFLNFKQCFSFLRCLIWDATTKAFSQSLLCFNLICDFRCSFVNC